ncbi:SMP-30/Gluconolaconase/LRE-like region containing protein [Novymonas esmeraldas]|uniref:SMP-30/Gluconolaconase/LRE-like region containing protein n=1 Tax=Novymonas esmeraldas TaxID=1808958 RepID=A0AAW0ES71_9TRYP
MAAQFQLTARRVTTPAGVAPCQLGESPTWDEERQTLWWVDIIGEALYVGQPAPGSVGDFDRVAVVPLPGHRPGFVVHAALPSKVADAVAAGRRSAVLHHAVWGSQAGLYYTICPSSLPWRTVGAVQRGPLRDASPASPPCYIAPFPQSLFPAQDGRVYRFNDGKVSPDGTLWCGGMMERTSAFPTRDPGSGALMQWDASAGISSRPSTAAAAAAAPDRAVQGFTVGVPTVTVSNGLGWSPAGDILYHVDTPAAVIRAHPYRAASAAAAAEPANPVGKGGKLAESYVYWALPRELKERGATLDGLCVDASGSVWVALAGIGEVVRLQARRVGVPVSLAVTITGVVRVPDASLTTSCCFGGEDLSTLYITTARGTSAEAAEKCTQEGAGWVYAVNLEGIAKGMPASRLRLPSSIPTAGPLHHL